MNGAILQQVFVVEYVIQYQMCDDCHRVEAKDFWKAVVQVRQKVGVCALIKSNLYLLFFYLNSNHVLNPLKISLNALCIYDPCLILRRFY